MAKIYDYVPQHIYLSDDTITYIVELEPKNKLWISWKASKIANLHEFVVNELDPYQTTIGERGVRLSGGQRQRIGLPELYTTIHKF